MRQPTLSRALWVVPGFRILLLFTFAFGTLDCVAEEESSRLRYTTPEKWQRAITNNKQLVSLTLPGGKATVTFAASAEFTGTAEEWRDGVWRDMAQVMKPAKAPVNGVRGQFLTRTSAFHNPDGSTPWVCLYSLVKDKHGETVVFFASDERQFLKHLPTVNKMVQGITVGENLRQPVKSVVVSTNGIAATNAPVMRRW